MAKQKKDVPADATNPDPEVRLTAVMPKSVRFKLRLHALRQGKNLEDMATEWLVDRLKHEEEEAARPNKRAK